MKRRNINIFVLNKITNLIIILQYCFWKTHILVFQLLHRCLNVHAGKTDSWSDRKWNCFVYRQSSAFRVCLILQWPTICISSRKYICCHSKRAFITQYDVLIGAFWYQSQFGLSLYLVIRHASHSMLTAPVRHTQPVPVSDESSHLHQCYQLS